MEREKRRTRKNPSTRADAEEATAPDILGKQTPPGFALRTEEGMHGDPTQEGEYTQTN